MWDCSLSIVDCTRSETLLFVRLCAAANEAEPPTLLVKACSTARGVGLTPPAVHKQSNQSVLHLHDRSYLLQNSCSSTIAPPAQGIPQQAMTHQYQDFVLTRSCIGLNVCSAGPSVRLRPLAICLIKGLGLELRLGLHSCVFHNAHALALAVAHAQQRYHNNNGNDTHCSHDAPRNGRNVEPAAITAGCLRGCQVSRQEVDRINLNAVLPQGILQQHTCSLANLRSASSVSLCATVAKQNASHTMQSSTRNITVTTSFGRTSESYTLT